MLIDKIFSFSQVTLVNLTLFLFIITSICVSLVFILAKSYHESIKDNMEKTHIYEVTQKNYIMLKYLVNNQKLLFKKLNETPLDFSDYLEEIEKISEHSEK